MAKNFKTFFVVNPRSGHGRGQKIWEQLHKEIKARTGHCDFEYTDAQGHGIILATEALNNGYEMVVAVGGDGTTNEVVNGFFEDGKPVSDKAVLGVIPAGTGGDFARTLGYPKSKEARLRLLEGRETRRIDLGQVTFLSIDEMTQTRFFVNVAGCGLPGELVDEISRMPRSLGGRVAYLLGLAKALRRHHNAKIAVEIDNSEPITKKALCAVVANGQYFGSGMHIAPDAILDDGWFDLILIGDVGVSDLLRNIHKVYTGTFRNHPQVEVYRAKEVRISSDEPVLLDLDGEQPGHLPATYKILPKALKLKA